MILIADSGSTKTDWAVLTQTGVVLRIQTKGMNPFFQTEEQLAEELRSVLLPCLPCEPVQQVYFYGAGCTAEKCPVVAAVLTEVLKVQQMAEVYSDMVGAARGLCGRSEGIVCILGTGSNSCLYDGHQIVANVSPLGFILGDEGSGAVLGKLLVGDLLKNQLGEELKQQFLQQFHLSPADIIDKVYRHPFPNRFLASLSPFLSQHLDHPGVHRLVKQSFMAFLKRNVMQYNGFENLPIHFIGSIAYHFRPVLEEAIKESGLHMGKVMKAPMEGLMEYYS